MVCVINVDEFKYEYYVMEREKEEKRKKLFFITVNFLLLFSMLLYAINYILMKYYIETNGSIYTFITLRTLLSIPFMIYMYGSNKKKSSSKKLLQCSEPYAEKKEELVNEGKECTQESHVSDYDANEERERTNSVKDKKKGKQRNKKNQEIFFLKIKGTSDRETEREAEKENGKEMETEKTTGEQQIERQEEKGSNKQRHKKSNEQTNTWGKVLCHNLTEEKLIPTNAYVPLLILSIATAIRQIIVITALQFTDSHNVGIIQPTIPVFTSILSYYLKLDKLDLITIISIVCTFVGLSVAVELWNIHSLDLGFCLLLTVPVTKGMQVIYISVASRYTNNNVIQFCQILALVLFTLPVGIIGEMLVNKQYNIFSSFWNLTVPQFCCIVYSTVAVIFICWKIQILALNSLTPIAVALYQAVQPCFTFALGKIILNETITIYKYIGTMFICFALFLRQYRNYKQTV